MMKGFVAMWLILLYCFNEQLFCYEWSCLDDVHFIVKNNFVLLVLSNVRTES